MKLLVVSQYFWPESFRINEVVRSLTACGHDVDILTGKPNYPDGNIFPGYRALGCSQGQWEGLTVYRLPLISRGKKSAIRLALNYVSFVCSGILFAPWQLRHQRYDAIFVYAPSPILQVIPALWLGRLKSAPVVVWVQDLWPESLEATGFLRNRSILAAVAKLVRWIYRQSDLLLVQSNAFMQTVQSMAGKTPVRYHPNPGDIAFGQPQVQKHSALRFQPGFNVVFAGNLGTVQALGTLLDAAEQLQQEPEVRFVLVGSGSLDLWLQQEVVRRKLTNVQLAGRFPHDSMPEILKQADVLLVSLVRSPAMSQTIPNKLQVYLAAGKPIIASLDGEGAAVLLESGAGLHCAAEDVEALVHAVRRLKLASQDELEAMGHAGLAYYKLHFEPQMLAHQLTRHFSYAIDAYRQ
ncbi:MAG: glycosyltransferase family 4 protein [Pseudomonadota bacterium]